MQLGYVDDSLIKLFLSFLSKKPSKILEYSNRELLEHLVDSRKSQKLIFSFILDNVKLAYSDFHASGFRATGTWINLNEFMNSKAYEFAKLTDIFIKNNQKLFNKSYKSRIFSKIDHLSNSKRQYLKGWFCYLFLHDKGLKTEMGFIGFCHHGFELSYYLANDFKKSVKSLLNENFSDEFCINNIVSIMGYNLSPKKAHLKSPITSQNYKSRLLDC